MLNTPNSTGLFVALEGLSGAGKTTLLAQITANLKKTFGPDKVVSTQEPWRRTSTVENELAGRELLNFVTQDRAAHLRELIEPALSIGQHVISSRYYMSTLVYQGYLDSLGLESCWTANEGFRVPDLTVFLYADEAIIERRLGLRSDPSRFEQKEYRARERYAYLEAVNFLSKRGQRILGLDSTTTAPEDLATTVQTEILALLR